MASRVPNSIDPMTSPSAESVNGAEQTSSAKRSQRLDRLCMAALAAAAALHSLPTLVDVSVRPFAISLDRRLSPNDDWMRLCALNAAARQTIVEHRAFPFRSPYFGGGYPTIAEPEEPTLSPFFLLTLLSDAVFGLKLRALVCVLIAALGTFHFCRRGLALARIGALAAAGLLVSATWFHARHLSGNITEMQYCFVPVLLCLLLRERGTRGTMAAMAAIMATMAIDGKLVWACTILYLGLVSVAWGVTRRDSRRLAWRLPARLLTAAVLSLLLAAARIVPMTCLLYEQGGAAGPRIYPHGPGYSRATIGGYSAITLKQSLLDPSYRAGANRAARLTVGRVALLAAVFGLIFGARALWWMVLPGLVCGWLMFSHYARPDIFRLLWQIPPFHTMTFPQKYFDFFFLFTLCTLCGWLLTKLNRELPKGVSSVTWAVLLVGLLCQPCAISYSITRHIYRMPCTQERERGEFFQVRSAFEAPSRPRLERSGTYLNFLANVGTIDWFTPLPIPTIVRPRARVHCDDTDRPNPLYRGEIHALPKQNRAWLVVHRPTHLVVAADVKQAGVIVINQNYSRWWRSTHGEVVDWNGLLAVRVGKQGTPTVVLRYLPWDFLLGLAVSSITALALAVWLWRPALRKPNGPTPRQSPPATDTEQ